jgi:hypothetical protein
LRFDKILQTGSFSDVSNYVIFINENPDVAATFGATVQFDFQGGALQNLADLTRQLDSLYTSIIATETGGAIVFVWRDVHSNACTKFVKSLTAMENANIGDSIVRFVFEYSENTFFRSTWWNNLASPVQAALTDRVINGTTIAPRKTNSLLPDGHRYVDWSITRRQTNRQI